MNNTLLQKSIRYILIAILGIFAIHFLINQNLILGCLSMVYARLELIQMSIDKLKNESVIRINRDFIKK